MGKLLADRLKKRADFLRAQKGIRRSAAGLTLEICPTPEPSGRDGRFRLGFTASRKVGGAVERNRAKRRLRAVAAAILPAEARERTDYVLIARPATLTRPFPELMKDLAQTLAAAHLRLAPPDRGPENRDGVG
ncbi:ribonuclease P protein component [Rhizomicrobium electricum]|uniref:Ribonuclease P protein component n=1 Tax=Rhizomicrobium electricum TaxID=480070 RepID=A0ABN1F5Y2_9PROT|nr:ribonuclease P protein component [Rhizomicrobium electricum]NIJ49466.1 ribonuclease P protein component [Rhizomicrobium electricum]